MTKTIYLIRHGELPEEYRGRYVGHGDPGLSEEGRHVSRHWETIDCRKCFASPLRRARESTVGFTGEVIIDHRLAEICFGDWEGCTYDEIEAMSDPSLLKLWHEEPENMVFPNGERVADFFVRVDEFFEELPRMIGEDAKVAVVTHGGILMRFLAQMRHIPSSRQFEVLPPRGEMVRVIWENGSWRDE